MGKKPERVIVLKEEKFTFTIDPKTITQDEDGLLTASGNTEEVVKNIGPGVDIVKSHPITIRIEGPRRRRSKKLPPPSLPS